MGNEAGLDDAPLGEPFFHVPSVSGSALIAPLRIPPSAYSIDAAQSLSENPPGGGSFGGGLRWLNCHSPLRGCPGLATLATAKIPRCRTPLSFRTDSYERAMTITCPATMRRIMVRGYTVA